MSYPIYAYVLGLLLALPIFVLVGVLGMMVVRLLMQWLVDDGSAPPRG